MIELVVLLLFVGVLGLGAWCLESPTARRLARAVREGATLAGFLVLGWLARAVDWCCDRDHTWPGNDPGAGRWR